MSQRSPIRAKRPSLSLRHFSRILKPFRAYAIQSRTRVADDRLLINGDWISIEPFSTFDLIDVHPDEPNGANALRVGGEVVYATAFPRTRERLEQRGLCLRSVDVSEIAKAEGALTCCSLIFDSDPAMAIG